MDGQGYSRVDLLVLTRTAGSSVRFLNLRSDSEYLTNRNHVHYAPSIFHAVCYTCLPLWGSSFMLSRTYLHLSRPCS